MFLDINKFNREQLAILDDSGTSLTYGEICNFVKDVEKLGLQRSIVFCMCENKAGALIGYIAFESLKIVPLLLKANMDEKLLSELEVTYAPKYFWQPKSAECHGKVVLEAYDYCLVETDNDVYPINEKLSLLMTTSGTTGSPKLVRYKYGNLEANAKNVAKVFGWTSAERCIADLPIQYTMGLNVINSHLIVGATILLIKSNLMSMDFWNFIKEQKGTNFTGVPYSYEIMMKLRFTRMQLPDIYTFAEGGGKLSDDLFIKLAEYAKENGKRFCPTFGTTETSARMAFTPPDKTLKKIGTIGKAIPEGELFLVDENGNEITEIEAQGELGYRGPNVTMGYGICKEDLLKDDEWQGEYHTGDIAKRDVDGFYYIVGRKKRFLKLYGLRVSLDQCERIIYDALNVSCACVGDDEKMKVFVEGNINPNIVKKVLSEKTALQPISFVVKMIKQLPRNSGGKILYGKLDVLE